MQKSLAKVAIVVLLAMAIAGVVYLKKYKRLAHGQAVTAIGVGLPALVDLGSDQCIPCKQMEPVLAALKEEYKGKLQVVFIDVWKQPETAKPYKVELIPTQIFFDAGGKELFRHEGFFAKEDILKKWQELGIELSKGSK